MSMKSTPALQSLARQRRIRTAQILFAAAALLGEPAGAVVVIRPVAAKPQAFRISQPAFKPTSVTLITGDVVTLDATGGVAAIVPGPGRGKVTFVKTVGHGETTVMPMDAAGLVQRHVVDPRFFNVSLLVKLGYDDAKKPAVPTIIRGLDGGAGPAALGLQAPRLLRAISGYAGGVDKRRASEFWSQLTQYGAVAPRTARFAPHLWLDGKRQLMLDQSVPQIGGPTAWAMGLTGKGVRVAVIDSGVDLTHPDLAGRFSATKNFTDEDANDNFGHGTHVASTIGGTGAASGGKYRGVAYEADLISAKVCYVDGCPDSLILDAMQWAAETQHARVVNMSLGGGPGSSVEQDPLEEAINTLSASTGALFVVAAGNSGCSRSPLGDGTVSSPSTADAALSVAAVDVHDAIADFSSCGPRGGDKAVKPEISAPGVDIVAARSSTGEFPPVTPDGYYTSLSGTSMATPHVAGSAAILAQQHANWSGATLKAALVGSAKFMPTTAEYQQGGGRVDIGTAVGRAWTSDTASVSFGSQAYPHNDDAVLTRRISYRNSGSAAVHLTLDVRAASLHGAAAPPGMFYLGANQIDVPAGGTASVDLMANTNVGAPDDAYSGLVTASDGKAVSTSLFSVDKEVESYNLTLTHISSFGPSPDFYGTYQTALNRLDAEMGPIAAPASTTGKVTMRLPRGIYQVQSLMSFLITDTALALPALNLTQDVSITLDASSAKAVTQTVPDRKAAPFMRVAEFFRGRLPLTNPTFFLSAYVNDPSRQLTVGRVTGAPPSFDDGPGYFTFSVYSELARLIDPLLIDYTHPLYSLAEVSRGVMPVGITKDYTEQDLARIAYRLPATDPAILSTGFPLPEVAGTASAYDVSAVYQSKALSGGQPPTDGLIYYVNTRPGLTWSNTAYFSVLSEGRALRLTSPSLAYQPGKQYVQDWTAQTPYSPTLDRSWANLLTPTSDAVWYDRAWKLAPFLRRSGQGVLPQSGFDVLLLDLEQLGDAAGNPGFVQAVGPAGADKLSTRIRLTQGGQTLADGYLSPSGSAAELAIPAQGGSYQLTVDTTDLGEVGRLLHLPASSSTVWTFNSPAGLVDQWTALPVSAIRLGGLSPGGTQDGQATPARLVLQIQHQTAVTQAADVVKRPAVELSADSGATWQSVIARFAGAGRWTVDVPASFAGKGLSIRATAATADGSTVSQTSIDAYPAATGQ